MMKALQKYYSILAGIICLLGVFIISQNAVAQNPDDAYEIRTFSASGIENIQATTAGGALLYEGSEKGEVRVEMYVRKRNRYLKNPDDRLDDYEITIEAKGSEIIAKAHKKRGWGRKNNLSVEFKIYGPQNVTLDYTTSGGPISASNVVGDIKLLTSGGPIKIKEIEGDMDIHTSGGPISAERVAGKLNARTSGGPIKVADADGDIRLRTSGGPIKLANVSGKDVDAETSGGPINADIMKLSGNVKLETSGGNISVRLPTGLGYRIDASGSWISTDLEGFKGSVKSNRMQGVVGNGGHEIYLRTSGGTINIKT